MRTVILYKSAMQKVNNEPPRGTMQANGIDDVLRILDGIIADTRARRDPLGYFPALYRQVTLTVKQGIASGYFDDGPRMDRFDALFADRYFAAYDTWTSG